MPESSATAQPARARTEPEADPSQHARAVLLHAAVVLLVLGGAAWLSWLLMPQVAAEDEWLEWAQASMLLAAAAVHGRAARRSPSAAMLRAGLGLLTLSFAVREVDIDRLGASPAWAAAETAVRGGIGLLWAWWAWTAVRRGRALPRLRPGVLRQPWFLLTVLGGLLYAASWPLDKNLLPLSHDLGLFLEELLELEATGALLGAALAMRGGRG